VGLAFGGIRHRIVGSCREKRLKMKKKAHAQLGFLVGGTPSSHGQWFAAFYRKRPAAASAERVRSNMR
jgi:hypothetical protein